MSVKLNALTLIVCGFFSTSCFAQPDTKTELLTVINELDEVVFGDGYNRCEIEKLRSVVSDSFEFYHDEHGVLASKEAFIAALRDGICRLQYKARRELVEGSMQVFPLRNAGELYGAIQTGSHRFYAKYDRRDEELTSIARFTTLWLREDGAWKMARVLSYDHRQP